MLIISTVLEVCLSATKQAIHSEAGNLNTLIKALLAITEVL